MGGGGGRGEGRDSGGMHTEPNDIVTACSLSSCPSLLSLLPTYPPPTLPQYPVHLSQAFLRVIQDSGAYHILTIFFIS